MTSRRAVVLARALGLVVVLIAAFLLLQEEVRPVEATVAAWLAEIVTGGDVFVARHLLVVVPSDQPVFIADLTPSCSALAAVTTLVVLAWVAPGGVHLRKAVALAVAVAVVVVGNLLRLSGSLAAGVWAGEASLVGFHDVVGGILTFVYILGGYVIMLAILLPARADTRELDHVAA